MRGCAFKNSRRLCDRGIALLLVLVVIFILSALALSASLFTLSRLRESQTIAGRTQAYYAALAGLEEVRGRLNASTPDAFPPSSLPTTVSQVVYLLNASPADPVDPTSPTNAYYDYEYASEFPGGLLGPTVLSSLATDQPGAGTRSSIPYKWVRITLKTEYSSGLDIDQDGILNRTMPIYWDGSNENLTSAGVPIYKLTALAVEPSGIRKLVQTEVAQSPSGSSSLPTDAVMSQGPVTVNGSAHGHTVNVIVNGNPTGGNGITSASTITLSGNYSITPTGSGRPNAPDVPQVSTLLSNLQSSSTPILTADPTHVTLGSGGTSYTGANVVLGTQAPASALTVYSGRALNISGASAGNGILLVNGNLSVTGGFSYNGLIVVNGSVSLTETSPHNHMAITGAIISSGSITLDSPAHRNSSLTITYSSSAINTPASSSTAPLTVRAFRELSY